MISRVNSIVLSGLEGFPVDIEVDIENGMPSFTMVGLPDLVVKEAKERVRSAIKNSEFDIPVSRITVNFAPGWIKKEGTHLDLAVAVGVLSCCGYIKTTLFNKSMFIGELSLNGEIRGVRGVLPMLLEARKNGYENIFIPCDNTEEAAYIKDINIFPVGTLNETVELINAEGEVRFLYNREYMVDERSSFDVDFSEIRGQRLAKRAAEVSASGGHNLIMIGSPGGGKTMIAKRIPTILPDLTYDEAIEVTKIYSIAGLLGNRSIIKTPPFRSPHHSASTISIVGGGTIPSPGEISLAHNGVLFLDEIAEFRKDALECLRQPMEEGKVYISRARGKYTFPGNIFLVAAMNPCPCGYYRSQLKECRCSEMQIRNYLGRISGPLLDRLDIHIAVEPIGFDEISSEVFNEESSASIRKRVIKAREIQADRFKNENIRLNSQMRPKQIKKYCSVKAAGLRLLEAAFKKLNLSTRAYNKILKISRTLADMDNSDEIAERHVAEAVQYRILDRKYWG